MTKEEFESNRIKHKHRLRELQYRALQDALNETCKSVYGYAVALSPVEDKPIHFPESWYGSHMGDSIVIRRAARFTVVRVM